MRESRNAVVLLVYRIRDGRGRPAAPAVDTDRRVGDKAKETRHPPTSSTTPKRREKKKRKRIVLRLKILSNPRYPDPAGQRRLRPSRSSSPPEPRLERSGGALSRRRRWCVTATASSPRARSASRSVWRGDATGLHLGLNRIEFGDDGIGTVI